MKKFVITTFFTLISLLLLVSCSRSPTGRQVTYNKEVLVNKYESENKREKIVEYIKGDEDLKRWNTLFSVRYYMDDIQAEGMLKSMILELYRIEKSGTDPFIQTIGATNNKKDEIFILEFTSGNKEFIQYNLFRYIPLKSGKLAAYHLSKRYYFREGISTDDDITAWLEEIYKEREANLEFLFSHKLKDELTSSGGEEMNIPVNSKTKDLVFNRRKGLS